MTDLTPIHILLVEDNPADARLITEYVSETEWGNTDAASPSITHVDRLEAARDSVTGDTDIVLLDLDLPDSTGVETLDKTVTATNTAPVVVLTGLDDERIGRDAVKRGAQDYLVKDDITPRLLQQTIQYAIEREQQQQELQRQNAELALLTQVVRHDIRNDMTVIHGWAEILENHIDEDGEDALNRVLQKSRHVIQITEVARDFVESLSDDGTAELEEIELQPILDSELATVRDSFSNAQFQVSGELPNVSVQANEMISSVFRNILENAVRHNDKETPEITVTSEVEMGTVRIRIADNGPGIPDNQKEQIFGKGEKGLDSPGSGIGLYLVYLLTGQFGGDVWVEDNDPTGSVFVVELPIHTPPN